VEAIKYIKFLKYCDNSEIAVMLNDESLSLFTAWGKNNPEYTSPTFSYFMFMAEANTLQAYAYRRQGVIELLTHALQISGIALPE